MDIDHLIARRTEILFLIAAGGEPEDENELTTLEREIRDAQDEADAAEAGVI